MVGHTKVDVSGDLSKTPERIFDVVINEVTKNIFLNRVQRWITECLFENLVLDKNSTNTCTSS